MSKSKNVKSNNLYI